MDLVEQIYGATKSFPNDEKLGLVGQMRRSSVSVPSNIAEGFTRFHKKEYKHFLYIALGSLAELTTQTLLSQRLNYLDTEAKPILKEADEIAKMTMSLIKKLAAND